MKRPSRPFSFGPLRSHTGIFRDMQMLIRLATLKEKNPAAYDRAMEELIGGREREVDESRRRFMKGTAGAAAGALGLEMLESFYRKAQAQGPSRDIKTLKVAIVGAGIAGLNCAWQLRSPAFVAAMRTAGYQLDVTIYEGRPNRTGGRMFTSQNDVAQGMHCELGAEFIDSTNDDMFALAQDPELGEVCKKHFGHKLALLDTGADLQTPGGDPRNPALTPQHLFVNDNGKMEHHTLEDAVKVLMPFVRKAVDEMTRINDLCEKIKGRGATSCGGTGAVGFNNAGEASTVLSSPANADVRRFDAMNVQQYFDTFLGIPRDSWLHGYLESAYTTEYGIPLELQSALGVVSVMGSQNEETGSGRLSSKKGTRVDVFGTSDERFKVVGGNDKIPRCITIALAEQALAAGKPNPINLGHKLVKVSRQDQVVEQTRVMNQSPVRNVAREAKYVLNFANGKTVTEVDLLVLACPLSTLSTITQQQYRQLAPRFSDRLSLRETWPRFARMDRSEPDYQPLFESPADLSALNIQRGTASRPSKADVIDRVGYGRNMKVMVGLDRPVWRQQSFGRFGGYTFSDRQFQMGWDSGQCQDLASLPTARQVPTGVDPDTKMKVMTVQKDAQRQPNHLIAQGRQFSWFLGGGISEKSVKEGKPQNFGEDLLSDKRLQGFVTHSRDSRVAPGPDTRRNKNDGDDVIRKAKGFSGDGITNPIYANNTPLWKQHEGAINEWVGRIVADTTKAYDTPLTPGSSASGFSQSYANQQAIQARFGRAASTSMIWTNDPFIKGSYLAYRAGKLVGTDAQLRSGGGTIVQDGQWTTMSGMEGAPLTIDGRIAPESQAQLAGGPNWRMFFAGEHCSTNFQGFMNGGAQTGRLAAQRILMSLCGSAAARAASPTELVKLYVPGRRSFFVSGLDRIFG